MNYVHEEENNWSNKSYKHPHNSNVWSDHFANAQNLVYYPLKSCHVALLNQLMLQYTVLYLLLSEVYVIREELKKFLPSPALSLFFLLQFQVTHVDPGVQLAHHSIE